MLLGLSSFTVFSSEMSNLKAMILSERFEDMVNMHLFKSMLISVLVGASLGIISTLLVEAFGLAFSSDTKVIIASAISGVTSGFMWNWLSSRQR
jgi:hypothetical protein